MIEICKGKEFLLINFKTLKYTPKKMCILCKKYNLGVQIPHGDYTLMVQSSLTQVKKEINTFV